MSFGIDALEYSKNRISEAEKDLASLNIKDADIKPKASENIDNIINFVSKLIEKGYAYPTEKGDVYYSVSKFNGYGKLSNRNLEDALNGVRKDVEEGKQDPLDFALWKSAKPNEVFWESPWGKGRPGWHIECSAMILANLGETIDIHGGGKDLVFPHHENEIAQSEALTDKPLAKLFSHSGLVKINGQKMSKSLGNTMTIKQALAKYHKEVIRYAMLEKHYSSDIDLTDDLFALSERQLYYFYKTIMNVETHDESGLHTVQPLQQSIVDEFADAMDDDFNTAKAISNIFMVCKYLNSNPSKEIKEKLIKTYEILGLLQEEPETFLNELKNKYLSKFSINETEVNDLVNKRTEAKKNKDFATADAIRKELTEKGIILNDSKEGTTWDIEALFSKID